MQACLNLSASQCSSAKDTKKHEGRCQSALISVLPEDARMRTGPISGQKN